MISPRPAHHIKVGSLTFSGDVGPHRDCSPSAHQVAPTVEQYSPFPDNRTIHPLAACVIPRSATERVDSCENGCTLLESGQVVSDVFSFSRWLCCCLRGWLGGIRCVEGLQRSSRSERLRDWNACPTECPGRIAASLHKLPYVDMRYNAINSILPACAEPGTAERTHKVVYVKDEAHDGRRRLAVGRGAREGN